MAEDYQKTENENQIKEWEKAREVLKDYDDRLHELRKYGFTFLTGLLTVDAFATKVISNTATPTSTVTEIPEILNLGIFVITLMLIVALHLLDKNYRVFQQAACTRAIVIERRMNMELSENINTRHKLDRLDHHVMHVYTIFIIGVTGLGLAILYPNWILMVILPVLSLGAWVFMHFQNKDIKLHFEQHNKAKHDKAIDKHAITKELEILQYVDWTISPLECNPDGTISVRLNNFNPKLNELPEENKVKIRFSEWLKKLFHKSDERDDGSILFSPGEKIWNIIDEDRVVVYSEITKKGIKVYDNYVWIVKPSDFENGGKEGIYRLQPKRWLGASLIRNITVHKSPPPKRKSRKLR